MTGKGREIFTIHSSQSMPVEVISNNTTRAPHFGLSKEAASHPSRTGTTSSTN